VGRLEVQRKCASKLFRFNDLQPRYFRLSSVFNLVAGVIPADPSVKETEGVDFVWREDIMRKVPIIRLLLFAFVLMAIPAAMAPAASAGFGVAITIAPPVLPVYVQPPCPGDGYIWTPGYWAYGPDGYYWVPGTWVIAPEVGFLWTPGYWGWGGGGYFWHAGYWGPHVGFYGGINYGFGYGGFGYEGGYWHGGHFFYNRSVNNVNVTNVHNVYNRTVINNHTNVNRVSFNGGRGGVNARPTSAEMAANRDHHIGATSAQKQHEHAASTDRAQFASVNHGRPSVTATARPGEFSNHGTVTANNNHNSNFARSNNNTRNSTNAARNSNNATQARSNGRNNNTFARSQNNANRTPVTRSQNNSTRLQQNNARPPESRSSNSRASNLRSSNPRPSNTRSFNAPQHNNATRQQSSPAYRQNTSHAAPSHQSRQPAPQRQSSSRPPSNAGRPAAQSQPHNNGGSRASSGGAHASSGGSHGGGDNHQRR
jgi:hypothetical protein